MSACPVCKKELQPGDMVTPMRVRDLTEKEFDAIRVEATERALLAGCEPACVEHCPPELRFIVRDQSRRGIHAYEAGE